MAGVLATGSEHAAFKSWIPGGTLESYEWKRAGNAQPGPRDERTFVLLPQGPVVSDGLGEGGGPHPITAFQPMCLTVRGTRLSSSGPIRLEPVTAPSCAFDWFPLLHAPSDHRHRGPL